MPESLRATQSEQSWPAEMLAAWGLEGPLRVEQITNGVYRIAMPSGISRILKDVGPDNGEGLQRLAFETEVQAHVMHFGLAVAIPLHATNGRNAVSRNGRLFALCVDLPHDPQDFAGPERNQLMGNFGRTIARMHHALAAFPKSELTARTWRTDLDHEVFERGVPSITNFLAESPPAWLHTLTSDLAPPMHHAFAGLTDQLIHRDCHGGNLLASGTEITGIIDWDHLSLGPRILDLAYFATQSAKRITQDSEAIASWLVDLQPLIAGYQVESPLSLHELASLPYVMIAVPAFFVPWLLETGQESGVQTELDLIGWLVENLSRVQEQIG